MSSTSHSPLIFMDLDLFPNKGCMHRKIVPICQFIRQLLHIKVYQALSPRDVCRCLWVRRPPGQWPALRSCSKWLGVDIYNFVLRSGSLSRADDRWSHLAGRYHPWTHKYTTQLHLQSPILEILLTQTNTGRKPLVSVTHNLCHWCLVQIVHIRIPTTLL